MISDDMSFHQYSSDYIFVSGDSISNDKKCCRNILSFEYIEDFRSMSLMGAIIKGNTDKIWWIFDFMLTSQSC